ncbi:MULTISPECIES: hypothetical protein [Nostocales]|uniref:Uncharacterized protein n=3 Tax=Nostocales TaxID=1161 RepID=A0A0C1N9H7_9CYAN|nr:hypothetical protein [Tolypothrix bouteillei]KAF3884935.1 hypothetical protein DA73_0400005275 [Tolypothrix bouteillei VB521301]
MTSSILNDNNAVEVDGVRFETIVLEPVFNVPKRTLVQKLLCVLQPLLPIPPGYFSPRYSVKIGIRITNNTPTPLRFSLYFTLFPEIVSVDSPDSPISFEGGCISPRAPLESDFPFVIPGESVAFFPNAEIFWIWGERLGLSMDSGEGGKWIFQPFKLGNYQFRFTYNNLKAMVTMYGSVSTDTKLIEGLWTGQVTTPLVDLHLVHL